MINSSKGPTSSNFISGGLYILREEEEVLATTATGGMAFSGSPNNLETPVSSLCPHINTGAFRQ